MGFSEVSWFNGGGAGSRGMTNDLRSTVPGRDRGGDSRVLLAFSRWSPGHAGLTSRSGEKRSSDLVIPGITRLATSQEVPNAESATASP